MEIWEDPGFQKKWDQGRREGQEAINAGVRILARGGTPTDAAGEVIKAILASSEYQDDNPARMLGVYAEIASHALSKAILDYNQASDFCKAMVANLPGDQT